MKEKDLLSLISGGVKPIIISRYAGQRFKLISFKETHNDMRMELRNGKITITGFYTKEGSYAPVAIPCIFSLNSDYVFRYTVAFLDSEAMAESFIALIEEDSRFGIENLDKEILQIFSEDQLNKVRVKSDESKKEMLRKRLREAEEKVAYADRTLKEAMENVEKFRLRMQE